MRSISIKFTDGIDATVSQHSQFRRGLKVGSTEHGIDSLFDDVCQISLLFGEFQRNVSPLVIVGFLQREKAGPESKCSKIGDLISK